MKTLKETTVYFRDDFAPFSEAQLSIASAPFLYGLSVYTTFPVFWNEQQAKLYVFRLPDHFKRLQNSSRIMAFDDWLTNWDYQRFERMVKQLLKQNKIRQDSLVRVSVFVDDILKGTRIHGLKHNLSAFVYPAVAMAPKGGAHLCISSWRRTSDNAIPSRAKVNGSYVNASLMKHEAVLNGFDDAIALDEQGHVAESTVANLFLIRDGHLITPSHTTDMMEGITRDTVFRMAEHFGIKHEQRAVDRSELYIAEEMFLSGSSMNITPVLSVDRRPIGHGKPGKITRQLIKTYEDCGRQKTNLFEQWVTPVG